MKHLIIGVLLLVGTISSMASDFTITPAFQQHRTFYEAGNQRIFFDYQFKIHNNMREPLYLNNQKVVYSSGSLKATFNPAESTCSFVIKKFNEATPVSPNKDCIIAYTYTIKRSVFLNGKTKSFISTLSVLDQLGLIVNYTATIKISASSKIASKHVLLVGIDGTREDAFKKAVKAINKDDKEYHLIYEMIKGGKQDYFIYAGGNSDRPETKQETSNAPGWATILTGVWADKHGINSNTDIEKNYHKKDIPTVFNDIKDAIPTAYTVSLAEWKDISTFANFKVKGQDDAASVAKDPDKDKNLDVTTKAIEELKRKSTPTFMLLNYDAVDKKARDSDGYDPEKSTYIDAIKTVLRDANKVLEEVQNLRDSGQQWLVIFTTDHGGKGKESKGRSWQERQVFATYHDPKDKRYSGGGEINAFQGQTNITPTILDYFGIPIKKNLYGKPINAAELPVRWLWAKYYWKKDYLADDYPQLARNVLPKLGDNIKKINKALMSGDSETSSKAYFFLNDGTYITYNVEKQTIVSGPEPIKSHWKCLTDPKIASAKIKGAVAFKDNNKNKEEYFFLFDNNYCTLCEPNPPHDTVKVNLSNPNSNYPKKLEKFSPGWAKLMNKYSASNSNLLIIRKGKRNSSKNIGSDTIYVLIDEVEKYVRIEPFNAHIPDSGIGSNDFNNHYWPGLGLFKIQTALSPSSNNDHSKEDKLTGYNYAVFLKPMKYN